MTRLFVRLAVAVIGALALAGILIGAGHPAAERGTRPWPALSIVTGAHAQVPTERAVLSARLSFDGRTDIVAAWSLQRLRTAYTGPLVRIRRSSDSTEADFYARGRFVSWAEISAFVGGGTGFVAKWYDQSGNARDQVQATAAAQPTVALLANGLPGLVFNGSSQYLQAIFALAQPYSVHTVTRRVADNGKQYQYWWDGAGTHAQGPLFFNKSGTGAPADVQIFAGSFGPKSDSNGTMPAGTRGAIGYQMNGAASLLAINAAAVAVTTGNTLTGGLSGLTLGANGLADFTFGGNVEFQEIVFFSTAHAQAQLQADNAAMRAAWRF